MRLKSDARETDQGRNTISDPRNPLVVTITTFEYGGDSEGFGCVSRRKAVGDKAVVAVVKGVAEVAVGRDLDGAAAMGGFLSDGVENHGVGCSFTRKDGSFLREGVFAPEADQVNSAWADGEESIGVYFAEVSVEVRKVVGLTEPGSVVRIGFDETSLDSDDRERG